MKSKHHNFVADLAWQIKAAKLPRPDLEVKFHSTRRWRFDLAWIVVDGQTVKIALEVEGAVWSQGRHTRGSGFVKDMEKYNNASLLGWTVYRVSTHQVTSGEALKLIERIFKSKPCG